MHRLVKTHKPSSPPKPLQSQATALADVFMQALQVTIVYGPGGEPPPQMKVVQCDCNKLGEDEGHGETRETKV